MAMTFAFSLTACGAAGSKQSIAQTYGIQDALVAQ